MKYLIVGLLSLFVMNLSACSSAPTGPSKEYQKRSAADADLQLDREVEKLKQ